MTYFFRYELEALMLRALVTGLLAAVVIFVGGVIFGWEYSLFLGFIILLAISLVGMVSHE
jgi:hypothetical protein